MAMSKQNVGGNESGQQTAFYSRGTSSSQNTWNYDGVNITDNAATGSAPMYFDFGAFEEINITTGGASPNMQTAGTGISFVIKQGTNKWVGQAQFYGNHNSLQSNNITPELQAQGAGTGAPIKYILDYGFDIGGPIMSDRAWIWGDYGVQDIHKGTVGFLKPGCDDADDVNCMMDDPTLLRSANAKFNLQITPVTSSISCGPTPIRAVRPAVRATLVRSRPHGGREACAGEFQGPLSSSSKTRTFSATTSC